MRQYTIAGHTIEIFGKGLGSFPEFDFFFSGNEDKCPLLKINSEAAVGDWAISPFFTFGNEKAFYDLSTKEKTYLFRMKLLDDNWLWAEIRQEDNCFQAAIQQRDIISSVWLSGVCKLLFNIASLSRQTVSIHSSVVMHQGKSILFLGESGTGKSTHTALWLKYLPNTELLNDDSPFIRIEADGSVQAYGSPWSGKIPCYKNRHTPIAAFVRLSQAPHNRIRRLKRNEAIGALLPSFSVSLLHEKKLAESIYAIVSQALQQTPVYHLECLPNADAVHLVYSTLIQDGFL